MKGRNGAQSGLVLYKSSTRVLCRDVKEKEKEDGSTRNPWRSIMSNLISFTIVGYRAWFGCIA